MNVLYLILLAAGGVAGGGTDYYGMQYPSCYSPATQGYSTPAAPGQPTVGSSAVSYIFSAVFFYFHYIIFFTRRTPGP